MDTAPTMTKTIETTRGEDRPVYEEVGEALPRFSLIGADLRAGDPTRER